MVTAALIDTRSERVDRWTNEPTASCTPLLEHAWRERLCVALQHPIEYIACDWSRVMEGEHLPTDEPEPRRLPADEEASIFRRMNYLKHRANNLRQLVTEEYYPPETLDVIQRRLDESMRLRNYLVRVFSKLAASVARQYANSEFRLDELLSEAHVTLLRCVEIFDADRGYRFSTYATNAIRHNLNRYVSRQHKIRQATREYIATETLVAPPLANSRGSEREYSARMSRIFNWLGHLDPREQTIVKSRYGLDQNPERATLQSLADQLGLSRERIRQLEHRAIKKLRAMAIEASID